MPVMDGLTALPLILKKRPEVKVIMASTLTRRNARISLQALGNEVGLTASPCWTRIRRMEAAGIIEGYTVRLGLRNTLQTQRGGEGRWRSVDWVTLDTDLVFRGQDADIDTLIPRYYGYRP